MTAVNDPLTLNRLTRDAPVVEADGATRTVTARLVAYNDPRPVVDVINGRRRSYVESHAPGSIAVAERAHVTDSHDGALVGHITSTRDAPDGLYGDVVVADTAAGRDVLALVTAGTLRAMSMEFIPGADGEVWSADGSAVTRTRSLLYGAAFAFRPAHDSQITHVREDPPPMAITDTPFLSAPAPPAAADAPPASTGVTVTPATGDVDALRRELVALSDVVTHRDDLAAHPFARFRSLSEWAEAAFADRTLARALVDQITTDNPGLIPPGWLSTVYGIVDKGRPAITALGGQRPLPDAGMDINWPYFDGDLTTIVAEQATQKTAVASVKVSFKRGTTDLDTFAGGSDVSYQLIRRSSPSYRDQYLSVLAAAYSLRTEYTFENALAAGATGSQLFDVAAATADTLRAALFAASTKVRNATGAPASVALASTDVWEKVGGLPGLMPQAYGVQNVAGTAQASTLTISVSGLAVVEGPYLPAGSLIVTNDQAASWHGDGPFVITAEDVEKLGQNVAIWGMGASALYLPAGIVELTPTGLPLAAGASGKSAK